MDVMDMTVVQLTLSARASEGRSTCLCVSVCLSLATLRMALFISTLKVRYKQLFIAVFSCSTFNRFC